MTSREEVAKKLRAKYKERTMPGFFEPQDVYFYTLNYLKDLEECLPDGESTFTVLADLIDPTCEVVGVPDNEEFMIRVVSGFTCKKCGHTALVNRNCGGWEDPLNYCPNCGARVVNGVPDEA